MLVRFNEVALLKRGNLSDVFTLYKSPCMRRQICPDELNFFYQKTGEAIWHLQYVEDFIAKLYFIKAVAKKPESIQASQAQIEMDKLKKKTLGQLIGLVEDNNIVSTELLEKLKNFNQQRIWIVHNSNRENKDSLYTDEGRTHFIDEIRSFTKLAIELQQIIGNEVLTFTTSFGISENQIYETANNHINKLRDKGLKL